MRDEFTEMMQSLSRIEAKLDAVKERNDEHGVRLATLEKRFWTGVGAMFISIAAYIKTLFQ
jgi:hypothetical protein